MERAAAAQVGKMEVQITAAAASVYLDKEPAAQVPVSAGLEAHPQQLELVEPTAVAAVVHIHVRQVMEA